MEKLLVRCEPTTSNPAISFADMGFIVLWAFNFWEVFCYVDSVQVSMVAD